MPAVLTGGVQRRHVAAAAALLLLLMVASPTHARDLRPSDHGLAYQATPPAGEEDSTPEMLTFFGTPSPPPPSASAPHPPAMALPQAMNSSDAALWLQQQDKPSASSSSSSSSSSSVAASRSGSSDRTVKQGLLIGSLVCGITGVALLAASALIFLFFTGEKKNSSLPPFSTSDHDHSMSAIACAQPATA